MLTTWATRRKVIYGILFFILGVIVIGLPLFLIFHKPASCSDGKQNGIEEGIDCGGSCRALCQNKQTKPIVLWTQKFMVSPGVYSVVAYMENPNVGAYAKRAPYKVALRDATGAVIAEREGEVYIPSRRVFAAFESNISTGTSTPVRAEFTFTKPPFFERAAREEPVLSVPTKVLSKEDTSPRIDATLRNDSIYNLGRIQVMAIVYEGNGNAVAASRTYVDSLAKGETKSVVFTWPNKFNTELASCEAPVDVVLLIDRSGSMAHDSANPPQPMTDVKTAAASFVDNLTVRDQGSVIAFATTPSVTPDFTLSTNFAELKKAITAIGVSSGGSTNIGDALKAAYTELTSTRHRKEARKEVILLTDGVPTTPEKKGDSEYPKSYALQAASELKTQDVTLYTIGLGANIDEPFLATLASTPESYFAAPTTATLRSIYKDIAKAICQKPPTVIEIIPLIEY